MVMRSTAREALFERFSLRGFFLILMLTSSGIVVSSVWKLHTIRSGSFRIDEAATPHAHDSDPSGHGDVELIKRDLRQLIRSENQELLQYLFNQINVIPDAENRSRRILDFGAPLGRSGLSESRNGTLLDIQREVPLPKELNREFWDRDWKLVIEEDVKVREYLTRFENTCETHDNLDRIRQTRGHINESLPLCPCVPATLKGRHKPNIEWLMSLTWEQTSNTAETVHFGGYWKPRDCIARRRVAIIVPCRDREQQLRAFLVHMHPLLQRQLIEYRIFVVEQTWPPIFNKASIMNAGFLEASKLFSFDCVMFHDVDLLAEDDRSIISCGNLALHYGAHLDKWGYNIGYARIFGGAVCLKREQFVKANGYSNSYYGWGGEDDDFDKRVRAAGYEIARPPMEVSRHSVLMHSRDKANPVNPGSSMSWRNRPNFYPQEGLNTVDYTTDDVILEPLYTWIKIRLKVPKERSMIAQTPYYYFRIRGACRLPIPEDIVIEQLPLSFTSCRYQCDFQPACKAIVYYSNIDNHCVMLRDFCLIDTHIVDATTYVKVFNESATRYTMKVGDCDRYDIDGLKVPLTSCITACNNNKLCAGFVYGELLSSPCWLKNGTCEEAKPNVLGVRSYTKIRT